MSEREFVVKASPGKEEDKFRQRFTNLNAHQIGNLVKDAVLDIEDIHHISIRAVQAEPEGERLQEVNQRQFMPKEAVIGKANVIFTCRFCCTRRWSSWYLVFSSIAVPLIRKSKILI